MLVLCLTLCTICIAQTLGGAMLLARYLNSEERHYLQLRTKDLIIEDLAGIVVDQETPELRLLQDGSEWALEMRPGQDWKVTANG